MITKKTFLFLFLVSLMSCGTTDNETSKFINLEVEGCFDKFENKVIICLDSVYNDSRCPTGLECVWEGDALAAFTFTKNKIVRRFNLHANHRFQNDTLIDGISIRLLDISPHPIADQQIDPNNYKVEISIEEN